MLCNLEQPPIPAVLGAGVDTPEQQQIHVECLVDSVGLETELSILLATRQVELPETEPPPAPAMWRAGAPRMQPPSSIATQRTETPEPEPLPPLDAQ
ncbi:unnamed protein product [Lampetra fluviatilis]